MEKKKVYKVLSSWFGKKDENGQQYSTWCKKISDGEVLCLLCNKKVSCLTKGWAALTQHESTNKHKEAAETKLCQSQMLLKPRDVLKEVPSLVSQKPLVASSTTIELCHFREEATKAELKWALKMIQNNTSTCFTEGISEVFKDMFGNVPPGFSLGRTKLTYLITDALGPYFRKELLVEARKSYYTILYDETTNNAGKKELQMMIRYWKEERVVCRYLTSVFLGHATADQIVNEILETLDRFELPLTRLISISSDGPNVNKKVFRLLNEKLLHTRGQGLVDVGTCNLHTVNNSYQKGLEEYGADVCELVVDVFYFFKDFPSRREDFESVQTKKNVPQHSFLKHVSSRWLTAGPACERILEQWAAIEYYFLVHIPKSEKQLMKTPKYKRIVSAVKRNDVQVELSFVVDSFSLFQSFMKKFQSSETLVHGLYLELLTLLKKIKGRVCKPSITDEEPIANENLLKAMPGNVNMSEKTLEKVKKLKETDQVTVCYKMQRHYMAAHNYLLKKSLNNEVLESCQCLQPSQIAGHSSIKHIGVLAEKFAFTTITAMDCQDEWRILQSEVPDEDGRRIEAYWIEVLERKSALGTLKYPSLSKVVKGCLCLAHGNADVERGFSVSRRVLSEDKCRMAEQVLNFRLIIKDALKGYKCITKVPITKELLNMARVAYQSHSAYVEEQKRVKDLKEKERIENEQRLLEETKQNEELCNKKQSIEKLENKAKAVGLEKKEAGESALSLLKEANERLKEGILNNDLKKVRIAQGMLEGAERLREQEKSHEKKEMKLNTIVHKRKSNIIDVLMNKKPKANART